MTYAFSPASSSSVQLRLDMDSQFDMEGNGNGALDHLTSSPISQPIAQPITGYFHRYQQLQAQRLDYDRLFEVSACLVSPLLILAQAEVVGRAV